MDVNQVKVRQTDRFIREDPSTVVLSRMTKNPDGAGGHTLAPTPLEPQVVKVVKTFPRATERRNTAGEIVTPTIYLVMYPDANVQNGDTFTWNGLSGEVVWINDFGYILHAEVAF